MTYPTITEEAVTNENPKPDHNIPAEFLKTSYKGTALTKKSLTHAYITKMWSIKRCSEFFRVQPSFISGCLYAWLILEPTSNTFNRNKGKGRQSSLPQEEVERLYFDKQLSIMHISKKLGKSYGAVRYCIQKLCIERGEQPRSLEEASYLRRKRELELLT